MKALQLLLTGERKKITENRKILAIMNAVTIIIIAIITAGNMVNAKYV